MKKQVIGVLVAVFVAGCSFNAPPPEAPMTASAASQMVYDFPAEGGQSAHAFRIPVPGWPSTRDKDKATYTSGSLVLETDREPIEQEDTLSGLKAVEKTNHYPGYKLTSIADRPNLGEYEAAQWEFTYARDGVPRQATVVGVGIGDVMITISYDAPRAEYAANRAVLDKALEVS